MSGLQVSTTFAEESPVFEPPAPQSIAETGLSEAFISDLTLKHIYFESYMGALSVARALRLPYKGVIEEVLEGLKRERMIEVKGTASSGIGTSSYEYAITSKGSERSREILERSHYVGPAPIPINSYIDGARRQALKDIRIRPKDIENTFSHLIISKEMFEQLGPAVNSSRSIFLFGPPGNGKTSIAEAIGFMILQDEIYIPYSIFAGGNIIKFYDPINHVLSQPPEPSSESGTGSLASKRIDHRWVRIRRPAIMVGGELTLEMLDLSYDVGGKFYEAPLQMKANGGLFLVDDFGRQQVRPQELLNRWIVPLEKRVDFLALQTGGSVEIPFDVLVIFATNLAPRDLVDEAFLRRIRHKIDVKNPTFDEYRKIFIAACRDKRVQYDDQALAYLLKEYYVKTNREVRACHPRDLIDQIIDISHFLDIPPKLSRDMLDRACRSYFAVVT